MSATPEQDEPLPEFDRLVAVEDRLLALETKGKWIVYELCYNDAPKIAFYIGITTDLERRVGQHKTNPSSAAYEGCQEGFVYGPIAEFNNYPEAKLFETMQIALRPSLHNRDIEDCRRRLCLPDEFWSVVDGWEKARMDFIRTVLPNVTDFAAKEAVAKLAGGPAILSEARGK